MHKLDYMKIYQASTEEILKEKKLEIKEIEDYLISKDDLSESFISLMKEEINSLENEFNVLINLKTMDLDHVDFLSINHLIEVSKDIDLPLRLYLSGGDYLLNSDSIEMLFKDEAIKRLKEINAFLALKGQQQLSFVEIDGLDEMYWTLEQIIIANNRINKMVNVIKENNLSPLEAIAFIHKIVTKSFFYQEDEENPILARSIIGVLNSDKIVCVGYASIVKAIVDKLENESLRSETVTIQVESNCNKNSIINDYIEIGVGHMQNLIFIHDNKYQINGVYLLDATYDSKTKQFPNGKGYTNFMFPVTDWLCYKDVKIKQYDNNLDELLGMSGIEADCPEIPKVIEMYQDKSEPISFKKIADSIKVAYQIIYSHLDEETINDKVESTLDYSMIISKGIFTEKASNAIRLEAELYEFE